MSSEPNRENIICVPAAIDGRTFSRFALFDTFRVQKRWRSPLLFAAILTAFALVCFSQRRTREQAELLGGVLLGVGLILPAVWILRYLSSVRQTARKLDRSRGSVAYTLLLREDGIRIVQGKEEAAFAWEELHMAWRVKDCVYLYVRPARAYLLPEGENTEAAWQLLAAHLPKTRQRDLRRH